MVKKQPRVAKKDARWIVVMGTTGCGKSTVGELLAASLEVPFLDADDLHPESNVAKMSAGTPLTDEDRWPWLADVGAWLAAQPEGGVIACSALKRAYRDAIREAQPAAYFAHLEAPQEVFEERVRARSAETGHFAAAGLVATQFAILERLTLAERGAAVDVTDTSPEQAALRFMTLSAA